MSRKDLYKSKAWKEIRKYIWIKQSCTCNRCKRAVYVDGLSQWIPPEKRLTGIVHHKKYLTDTNYTDPIIAYNEDNLEGICIDCHNQEHFNKRVIRKGLWFDEQGNLTDIPPRSTKDTRE